MAQSSKNTSNESRQEKVMTKYDRKVAKRKAERAREIRNKKIAISVALILCVGLVIGIGTAVGVNLYKIYYSYIKVDGNPVSEIEFDFYYSLYKNSMLNNRSQISKLKCRGNSSLDRQYLFLPHIKKEMMS